MGGCAADSQDAVTWVWVGRLNLGAQSCPPESLVGALPEKVWTSAQGQRVGWLPCEDKSMPCPWEPCESCLTWTRVFADVIKLSIPRKSSQIIQVGPKFRTLCL